jgi:uncharacterized protein YdhG (YjbR/CyaY superfamily)
MRMAAREVRNEGKEEHRQVLEAVVLIEEALDQQGTKLISRHS